MTFATDRNDDEDDQNDGERCISLLPAFSALSPASLFFFGCLSFFPRLLLLRCTECIFDSAIVMSQLGEESFSQAVVSRKGASGQLIMLPMLEAVSYFAHCLLLHTASVRQPKNTHELNRYAQRLGSPLCNRFAFELLFCARSGQKDLPADPIPRGSRQRVVRENDVSL